MTDVAITRSQSAKPLARTPHRAQPLAEDVRAMSEAFSKARGDTRPPVGKFLDQPGKLPQEKKSAVPTAQTAAEFHTELAQAAGLRAADERGALDRREAEKGSDQALALVTPNAQPAAQGAAPLPAPAPHVDPAAFAQALADLWTRENGRGDKRVQVMFGADAWPATGALLAQSADGLLDVTVEMAASGPALPSAELKDAFAAAGLSVGRVATA